MIDSYVALDLETTGIRTATDRIIEVGMVRVEQGEQKATYSQLFDPGMQLPERIEELTGIQNAMLKSQPCIEEKISFILDFIGELPILGHNVIFDYSFLKKAAVNQNLQFEAEGIDTLKIARRILPDVPHKNLSYLCDYFQIDTGNSHRAYDDAVSAMQLFERMKTIKPEDSGFAMPSRMVCAVKKDSMITAAQKRYLQDLVRQHQLELPMAIERMTRSNASRTIDQILSTYGRDPVKRQRENLEART